MTENANIDMWNILDMELDLKSTFSFRNGFGRNCIIFGVTSSVHVYNKNKDILVLGEGPTQRLDDTTLTAEKKYSINFTENNKKICLSLHDNWANSYLFVNGIKAKDPEIAATPFCLGNISKDWSVDKMKKTGLNGYVSDFTVDYSDTAADDILDIHSYLMKKLG